MKQATDKLLLECAPVRELASDGPSSEELRKMARRRYQRGSLYESAGGWGMRYRLDEIQDGKIVRRMLREFLGTKKELPTKSLAKREMEDRLRKINSLNYRPLRSAAFKAFAEEWIKVVLTQDKPSTQAADRSRIRKHLIPAFGATCVKDIDALLVQQFVASSTLAPKSIRNLVGLMERMWVKARAWGFSDREPFRDLSLPKSDRAAQPYFTLEQVRRIVAEARAPYNVVFALEFEAGLRRGEICALNVGDIDLSERIVVVQRSRWGKHITDNKSRRPRVFSISSEMVERLRFYVENRTAEEPLFLTPRIVTSNGKSIGGKRLHPDNFVKRELKPVLEKLQIVGATHAFRHGNATWMDRNNVPMAVRQDRLGHVDTKTTMGYTHKASADDRQVSERIGAELWADTVM